jgi:predicted ester cyclase
MSFDLDRLLRLWTEPLGEQAAAEAAFREIYADPVIVNGVPLTTSDVVARARTAQQTYDGLGMELDEVVQAPGRVVIAFQMHGRHVGPLTTPLGLVAPTGRTVEFRVVDVLTFDDDGLVTAIWMLADELGLVRQVADVKLITDN